MNTSRKHRREGTQKQNTTTSTSGPYDNLTRPSLYHGMSVAMDVCESTDANLAFGANHPYDYEIQSNHTHFHASRSCTADLHRACSR